MFFLDIFHFRSKQHTTFRRMAVCPSSSHCCRPTDVDVKLRVPCSTVTLFSMEFISYTWWIVKELVGSHMLLSDGRRFTVTHSSNWI